MIHREPDQNDPADVRWAANRLYCRLKRLGFHLQRGRTVKPEDHHIQLKKVPVQRGYRITDSVTGETVLGDGFSADYHQVYGFWERAVARYWAEKRQADKEAKMAHDMNDFIVRKGNDLVIQVNDYAFYTTYDPLLHKVLGNVIRGCKVNQGTRLEEKASRQPSF